MLVIYDIAMPFNFIERFATDQPADMSKCKYVRGMFPSTAGKTRKVAIGVKVNINLNIMRWKTHEEL